MAELVDAPDSKSGIREGVGVRFPLPVPNTENNAVRFRRDADQFGWHRARCLISPKDGSFACANAAGWCYRSLHQSGAEPAWAAGNRLRSAIFAMPSRTERV